MNVDGKHFRTVWVDKDEHPIVKIIDQTKLPFAFEIENLDSVESLVSAIKNMHVRGAGCIGVTAAYGMWLAANQSRGSYSQLESLASKILEARPTATNLSWAVKRQLDLVAKNKNENWITLTLNEANKISDEDARWCNEIGNHGKTILYNIAKNKSN